MHNSSNIDLEANLVITKRKPGALIVLNSFEKEEEVGAYTSAGLQVVEGKRRNQRQGIAVSYDTPAQLVIDTSRVILDTTEKFGNFDEIMKRVKALNIAEALIFLNNISSDRLNDDPRPAILEGALLGYENCDITYHAATRYLDEPRDPRSDTLLSRSIPVYLWPDKHLLCGRCAVSKMVKLDSTYSTAL